MRKLRIALECSPAATCESFGLCKTPLPVSTSNHLPLDFSSFTSTWKKGQGDYRSFEATASANAASSKTGDSPVAPEKCLACAGRHRKHTFKPGCEKYAGEEPSTEGTSAPSRGVPKPPTAGIHAYMPKLPVKAGAVVPGADKGAGVGPLESSEHSAPEPASSSGD